MSRVEETWQGYTSSGVRIDNPVTLQEAAEGALHGSSHVWIWRYSPKGIELLLQKRAADKRTWPGWMDISAAGHMLFGDSALDTALRETQEELGLKVQADRLKLLFVHRTHIISPDALSTHENEFRWVYSYELRSDTKLRFTDGEVESVSWIALSDFRKLSTGRSKEKRIVPQGNGYFVNLLEALEKFA